MTAIGLTQGMDIYANLCENVAVGQKQTLIKTTHTHTAEDEPPQKKYFCATTLTPIGNGDVIGYSEVKYTSLPSR